jgi:putative transposase
MSYEEKYYLVYRFFNGPKNMHTLFFLMHVHLVFVKKYRRKIFTKQIIEDLREIFAGVCQSFEAELRDFYYKGDHVRLLVNYPPKVQVSRLVNSLKTASSRVIRKKAYPTV